MKTILLLVLVVFVCGALPASASAHHLPWKQLRKLVDAKQQEAVNGIASKYATNDVWGESARVRARPHFGRYWRHVYGYIYGTVCFVVCGLPTKFYFTCVSWVDFRLASESARYVGIRTIRGACYSFWIDNPAVCGGGPCISGFSPGDTRPPAGVPATNYEWTRSWKYWPNLFDPP